ncbi:MAG: hypothetical protein KIS86_12010 [Devosia sp.]|nr:hypothetical protein [Devosia sp.]
MAETTQLSCLCGAFALAVIGSPIITTECHCRSCRESGARLAALPASRPVLAPNGGTPFVLYRKDRVRFVRGMEQLAVFRRTPDTPTRRVVARCCNTVAFLEFKGGHWLSLYAGLWPQGSAPLPAIRTMTSDLPAGESLAGDIPAGKLVTAGFYARLLGAWLAMGFKSPDIAIANEIEA